jgi:prevent-host-death family protein
MRSWQLQAAKAHLSKLVRDVMADGPQEISLRGKAAVVVISKKQYDKLIKPQSSFVVFMRRSPWVSTPIKLKRDRSLVRKVDL